MNLSVGCVHQAAVNCGFGSSSVLTSKTEKLNNMAKLAVSNFEGIGRGGKDVGPVKEKFLIIEQFYYVSSLDYCNDSLPGLCRRARQNRLQSATANWWARALANSRLMTLYITPMIVDRGLERNTGCVGVKHL